MKKTSFITFVSPSIQEKWQQEQKIKEEQRFAKLSQQNKAKKEADQWYTEHLSNMTNDQLMIEECKVNDSEGFNQGDTGSLETYAAIEAEITKRGGYAQIAGWQ